MSIPEFKELLHKYNTGACTEEEKALIESWYMGFELKERAGLTDEQIAEILSLRPGALPERKIVPLIKWISVAAAVLICISAGIFYFTHGKRSQKQMAQSQADVSPGSSKAVLTLSNGQKIVLNAAQNGKLAYQGKMVIKKTADGEVEYAASEKGKTSNPAAMVYNTMSTPRGGEYHLVLADGTNVWLNAASSIKYPVQFSGDERKVEITGEAYFEVTSNRAKPFRVVVNGQTIEDIGTHFDVNAYDDEPVMKTTLLEGGISVTNVKQLVILKPGEQAISGTDNNITVAAADTEEAVAWKNGDFIFKNQTLPDIMREISRWYNVQVNYEGYINKGLTFSGVVSRSRNLSAVLKMLESTGDIKFSIEGNDIRIVN